MPPTSPPYSQLALIWDHMRQDSHSKHMVPYAQEVLRRLKAKPQSALDLCCGTGSAIELMIAAGIPTDGLDQSAAMLAMAARKLKGRGVTLYRKSLPDFRIPIGRDATRMRQYDLITCFFDSLNYLTKAADLQKAFRCVKRHLAPGGVFIFDMNTPHALQTIWDEQVYADARDDLGWVWKNHYDPGRRLATCEATCFYKKGTAWHRFDEVHYERGYDNEQIKRMLITAGLKIRGFWKCHTFSRPTKITYRIAVAAQRPK
ncbi:MAG: class I SAM-dependent methyltransferase [bacterium]